MGKVETLQANIKRNTATITNDAYFLGGTNTKRSALQQYDFLRTGYGRLFIMRLPTFVNYLLPEESKKFKHLLEFGNVGVDGIQGYTVDFASVNGGYVGNNVEIPMNVKDDTNAVTIKLYETQGSLIREYIDFWLTGIGDTFTGFSHYHGARLFDPSITASQAHQTMEAIYINTDQTGEALEYACLLTNMVPKGSDHSHFNYEPGSHDLVNVSVEFTCMKYLSPQINLIGKTLVNKFKIMTNYLNMTSGFTTAWVNAKPDLDIHGWKDTKEYWSSKAVPVTEVQTPEL